MNNLLKRLNRYGIYHGGICRVFEGDGGSGGGGESQSIINPDGTFPENWCDKYGDDNKAYLSRFKDLDSLVNTNVSLRKKFSKDPSTLVEIPGEHSSDEVRAAFRKANGVPDTTDDYEYMLPDELSTKLEPVNEDKMAKFKEFAHKELELSPAKFRKLLDFYHNDIAASIDQYDVLFNERKAAEAAAAKAELRKQPGWKSDEEYNDKVALANAVMRKYGGEEAVAAFNAENSPLMTRFLANIAGAMSEATLKGLAPSTAVTKDSIKTQIAEIRSKMDKIMKENPVNFKVNPEFKDLMQRKTELYKQIA